MSRYRATSESGGFSLVETVLAVLLLGGALASILSMVTTSVRQMGQQKMQAAASGFAAGQMNRVLFDEPFEAVDTTEYTEVSLDGIRFRYKIDVVPIDNASISFKFDHFPWHDPRHGASSATGAEPSPPATEERNRPVTELDSKSTAGGIPILKDILMTVQWHGPGQTFDEANSLKLITRKARL